MYLIAGQNPEKTFELCPPGTYVGRVFNITQLGTQESNFNGEIRTRPMLSLSVEILDEDTRRTDGVIFTLSRQFTASLHEKSAFRPVAQALLGRPITDGERVNLRDLVGRYCMVVVTHATSSQGKTFANIDRIVPLPKNTAKPGPVNDTVCYLIDEDAEAILATLPERIQKLVRQSPEYSLRQQADASKATPRPPVPPRPPAPRTMADLDDDIPF